MAHGQRFYLDEFGQYHDLEHEPTITRDLTAEREARQRAYEHKRTAKLEAKVDRLQKLIDDEIRSVHARIDSLVDRIAALLNGE